MQRRLIMLAAGTLLAMTMAVGVMGPGTKASANGAIRESSTFVMRGDTDGKVVKVFSPTSPTSSTPQFSTAQQQLSSNEARNDPVLWMYLFFGIIALLIAYWIMRKRR